VRIGKKERIKQNKVKAREEQVRARIKNKERIPIEGKVV
jgi:hypothetical protein